MGKEGFIEDFGLFASLSVAMIGGGMFFAPSIIANYIGANGWVAALISGVILYLIFLLIFKLIKTNKYKLIGRILQNNYGSAIGKLLALAYSISLIIVLSFSLRTFGEVMGMYLLTNTPMEVIIITLIFMVVYLSRGGLANVVHFNEIVFWFMFIPIGIMLILTLPQADFSNLLPMFYGYDSIDYFKAIGEMLYLFVGFSVAFILLPYVRRKKNIKKIVGISSIFASVFYAIVFILVCATLSTRQTADSIFPTITMIQSMSDRSGILEKWDSIIMILWVMFYYTSFANIYYFSSITLKEVLNLHDIRIASMIYAPVLYVAAMYPDNVINIINLSYGNVRIWFIGIIVIIVLITLFISLSKRRSTNEK